MSRVATLAKGLAALVLLVALVAGVPLALWHFVGWPLPHHVPSLSTIGHALDHRGIPARTLVDALAVVVWITWAVLVASVAAEIPAALGGRLAPRLPVAGVFQPVTGRLVATVVVACLALAPRPGHSPTSGGPGAGLAPVRRPVAALVLTGDRRPLPPRAPPTPPPGANTAATGAAPRGTPVAAPAAGSASTYVVQRGDTLWGIAERQLGDPLEWSQIYALNEGRSQPGGATLTDPHWIDPGWTLLLPATPAPATPSTPTESPAPPATAPAPPAAPSPPTHTPTRTATRSSAAPSAEAPSAEATSPGAHHEPTIAGSANGAPGDHRRAAGQAGAPVRLPSGSLVGGSFAAGVLSAVALGRLRRRHAYRYHPPEPGRDLTPEPLRPTLRHLARVAGSPWEWEADPGAVPVFPFDDTERRQEPGRLEVGARNAGTVTVELTDLSGVALCGPATDDIARAVVAGLLVRAEPGAVEVLLTTALVLPAGLDDNALAGLSADVSV